jgi:hypothetical protein
MPLSARKPVGFFVFGGAFVLEVKVERPIRIGLERKVAADRETIERVRHLKALSVISRDGPEGVDRRRGSLVEADPIFVRAVERLAPRLDETLRDLSAMDAAGSKLTGQPGDPVSRTGLDRARLTRPAQLSAVGA